MAHKTCFRNGGVESICCLLALDCSVAGCGRHQGGLKDNDPAIYMCVCVFNS